MPTEVQNGTAVLYGIRNNGTAISIEGYATTLIDTAKIGHKFKLTEVQDESEHDAALIATNAIFELDITFVPSGESREDAEAVATFLDPLSKVELDNFALPILNRDYIYIGDGSIDLSHSTGKMSLKLRSYADADQNASLTQTIAV